MNGSSVALSVLGTIAVAGYVAYTEFPFWERWTNKDEATSNEPKLVKRTKKPRKKAKRKKVEKEQKPAAAPTPAKTYRSGDTGVYWIDKICDCQQATAIVLETIELTATHTILNLLNAYQGEVSAYTKDSPYAMHLLEWRYIDGNRPRLELEDMTDIPAYPRFDDPLHFQLIFPRVSDEAPKFQLSGKASTKLDYFMFTSIDFENKMTPEEADNFNAYRRCGFNAVPELPVDQEKRFSAHKQPGTSGYRWTASPELEIVGSSRKDAITVRGVSAGKGEVCLNARKDGASCRYCQDVRVEPENDEIEADFKMTKCGGLPSNEPHWQFTVTNPTRGASYWWEAKPGLTKRSSGRQKTFHMTPNLRPGKFTITLNTTTKSGKSSTSREYHSVYSCVERF